MSSNKKPAASPSPPPPPSSTSETEAQPPWYYPSRYSVLFHRVSLEEYPWIKTTEGVTDVPGLTVLELSMLRGIRYACGIGFVVSPVVWYVHRKTLPFADRPLAKIHHYFFPSAGYAVPVGALYGFVESIMEARRLYGGPLPTKDGERRLVQTALTVRMNKSNDLWSRTAGRLGFWGMVTTVIFWKGGNPMFRGAMGFGTGVTCAAFISAAGIDKQIELF